MQMMMFGKVSLALALLAQLGSNLHSNWHHYT